MTTFDFSSGIVDRWRLKKVKISELPILTCANQFSWAVLISESHLCARDTYSKNAICSELGGGFLGTSDLGYHVVHGVESFRFQEISEGHCNSHQLSVFTRVSSHVDWVEKMITKISGK